MLPRKLQRIDTVIGLGNDLKRARELLAQSELTVQRVLEENDGTLGTDDLDL